MAIAVTCGGCRKTFNVKDEWAGKAGKCPACGARITVPMPQLDVLEEAPVAAAPPPRPAAPPSPPPPRMAAPPLPSRRMAPPPPRQATQPLAATPGGGIPQGAAPDDGAARCPACGSTSVQAVAKGFGGGKGLLGCLLGGPLGLLCGFCGSGKLRRVCLRCGHKWKL